MKLWRLIQTVNNDYDTFDSCVVAAETEEEARFTKPTYYETDTPWNGKDASWSVWCAAKDVQVEYIGEAKEGTKRSVICASFNAG